MQLGTGTEVTYASAAHWWVNLLDLRFPIGLS